MKHILKKEYARVKLNNIKPFEIRKNDRNYQVGDYIYYRVVDANENDFEKIIELNVYRIIYITDHEQKTGFVVFTDCLDHMLSREEEKLFSKDFRYIFLNKKV